MTPRASPTALQRDRLLLAALVVGLGVAYALLARIALHGFPFSGDEYSYLLQGEIFARGLLHTPAPPHPELLRVDHVILEPWVCSKYPPGTSALLAIGVRLGVPWLVTPIEGVVALVAMAFAARRVLGRHEALLAVGLLGAAPLFAFQAASFFSHTAATMWLALAFAAVVAFTDDGRARWMVLSGTALGCALVTRPLDAVLFALALLSLRSVRAVALAAAGAAPFGAALLAYQAAQYGSALRDGYAAYEPTFRAIYGARAAASPLSLANFLDSRQIPHHLDIVRSLALDWTVPGTVLLAVLGWVALGDDGPGRTVRRLCAVLFVLFGVTLLFTIGGIDDGARARYLSTLLIPLAFLGARGWGIARDLLATRVGRGTRLGIGVGVAALAIAQTVGVVIDRRSPLAQREQLFTRVRDAGLEGVVVVRTDFPTRYARNGPFFDGPVLYVSAPGTTPLDEIAGDFPGRAVYEAHEGGETWSVRPRVSGPR